MKKIKILFLLISFLFATTSCEMDLVPDSAVPEHEALRTLDDCDAWVVGIYSAFKNSALYSGYMTLLPDIQADMAYSALNTNTGIYTNFYQWDILSTTPEIASVYNGLYNIVARCNFFFDYKEQVEKTLETTSDKDEFKKRLADVYFARALAYAELIRFFCEPMTSENANSEDMGICLPITYRDDVPMVKRSTLLESYTQVLSDLKNSEDNMPDTRTAADSHYFSKGAVYALRSRVYLYMGMGDLKRDNENEYLKKSVEAATKAIKLNVYKLSDAINNAFSIGGKPYTDYQVMWMRDGSDEIIWKIGMSVNSYGGALGKNLLGYNNVDYSPQYHFPEAILSLYAEGDKRPASFSANTEDVNGDEVHLIIKYPGNTDLDGGDIPKFVNMPKPLRISEVYLNRAEAYYWLGEDENAQKDLSSLKRKRITGFGGVGVAGDDLLKEIKDERVRELYLEGFRLSDLKRWRDPIKRKMQKYSMGGPLSNQLEVKYGDAKYRFTTWPIPKHEIEATNGLVVGNKSNY